MAIKEIKYLLILTIIILFSNIALAVVSCNPIDGDETHQGCVEIKSKVFNTTTPIINVTFTEWVEANDDYALYKIGELGESYPNNTFSEDFLDELKSMKNYSLQSLSQYLYQSDYHLPNGIYLFKMSAFNEPNINIDISVLFSINGTGMKFWVSSPTNDLVGPEDYPMYAFSNESIFDIELSAERDVEGCRWTTRDIPKNVTLLSAFENITVERFSETGNPRSVVLSEFDITLHYPYSSYDGSPRYMSIICREVGGRLSLNTIVVGVDKSAPTIDITTDYSPVVDYDSRKTNITIRTSDVSACRINKVFVQNYDTPSKISEMSGLPLLIRGQDFDFKRYEDFVSTYTEPLVFSRNPNPHNYTYNITCTNLANLKNSRTYVVSVNLLNIQSFEFYSPVSGYVNSLNILVNGSVNRGGNEVSCNASLNMSAPFTGLKRGAPFNGRQVFFNTINVPGDGTHTIYVTCVYMEGTFSSTTVTVDRTPPVAPNITTSDNSCSLEEITARVSSRDNISGVRRYYYNLTVDSANNEYISGSSTSGRISIDIDGELDEGKTYVLRVWADDNAGNKGPQSSKNIKITNSSVAACDTIPPKIKINSSQNNSTNIWTVAVDCQDDESGCKKTFYYGIESNSSKKCNETKSANLLSPISISTSSVFCARVQDNNNNNASDSREFIVSYPINCSNNATDGKETDLNCGGDCPKCGLNKTCSKDSDCSSNYCFNKKCAQPSCTDKIKNGDEAGIDCGGSCTQKCGINLTCESNEDCQSLNCDSSGKCAEATCTDKKKDGKETDVDCGGTLCPACGRMDKCITSADCSTKYCASSGFCDIDPSLDSDGDGLPDLWEENNCGSVTGCEPKDDLDKDGYTNREENEANTDPRDPDSKPDYKKYNPVSIILLILGALLIIAGITMKVINSMEEEKKKKLLDQKEMYGTLSQIPKMSSLDKPAERELTEEEKLRSQQARMKAIKERSTERRKMLDQFDSEEKVSSVKQQGDVQKESPKEKEPEQKPIQLKKKKLLDDDFEDEYVDLSKVKEAKSNEDPFSKLKNIASKEPDSKAQPREKSEDKQKPDHAKKETDSQDKKQRPKPQKNEDVFEKLKTISKAKKK